jgi:uncharacterized membrane protein
MLLLAILSVPDSLDGVEPLVKLHRETFNELLPSTALLARLRALARNLLGLHAHYLV